LALHRLLNLHSLVCVPKFSSFFIIFAVRDCLVQYNRQSVTTVKPSLDPEAGKGGQLFNARPSSAQSSSVIRVDHWQPAASISHFSTAGPLLIHAPPTASYPGHGRSATDSRVPWPHHQIEPSAQLYAHGSLLPVPPQRVLLSRPSQSLGGVQRDMNRPYGSGTKPSPTKF
jgi:hypothetical protein